MERIYVGKTKDVFKQDDGNYLLKFKDDVTGKDGKFDPGENQIGLTIEGMGKICVRLSTYFFKKIEEAGIKTHFVSSDIDNNEMVVKPAKIFGNGLEVICRLRAVGSFIRRYGSYAKDGQKLDHFVEITLKDDEREDPPISEDALEMLGLLTKEQYSELRELCKKSTDVIANELSKLDLDLYDIKFEFGFVGNEIVLIDEISGGNMRVYQNGKYLPPTELNKILLKSGI